MIHERKQVCDEIGVFVFSHSRAIAPTGRQFIQHTCEVPTQFGSDHRKRSCDIADAMNKHDRRPGAPQGVAQQIPASIHDAGPAFVREPCERVSHRNICRSLDRLFAHLSNAMLAKLTLS